jgi:GTP-binding protein EngB required for normal cell division
MMSGSPLWPVFDTGSPLPETPAAGKADRPRPARARSPWARKSSPEAPAAEPPGAAPANPEPVTTGPPWARQTTPEAVTAGPPWARQTTPEPAKPGPPWDLQTSPEPAAAQSATAGPPWATQASPEQVLAEPAWDQPRSPEQASLEAVRTAPVTPAPPGRPDGVPPDTVAPRARLHGLSARLTALARLIQIGSARVGDGGFSEELLRDAEALEERAGERLRLSAGHTVVALAGGTGSGKSALFNQLAGHEFSAVGVTRPVTREPHACVWGTSGSGPLLEWLGVPRRFRYGRGSALDGGEAALHGLILLDLPDHDSVVTGDSSQVDRLVGMADLMVWVLDPQKYADAAVHRKYLVPLAGHSAVIAVVLNQSDLLSPAEIGECVGDLRRLLDSEGLQEAAVVVTSAITGAGLDQLRELLVETVSERTATSTRISADVDGIAAQFAPYAAPQAEGTGQPWVADPTALDAAQLAGRIPPGGEEQLVNAFSRASGVSAVGDALQSARELRAVDFVGWPVAWMAERLSGSDPVRKIRLGTLWSELRSTSAGPSDAQQAEIDSALTKLADQACPPLPLPWSRTTRSALRSRGEQIPAALGAVMGESLPPENTITPWWRFVGALQGLLLGCVIVSLAWMVVLLIFGFFHAANNVPRLFSEPALLPWAFILTVAFLLLGWLTAAGCLNLVRSGAARERERVQETMRAKIGVVAREMVLLPAEEELAEYRRFVDEFRIVADA